MRLALLLGLAACSFKASNAPVDGPPPHDATAVSDAPSGVPLDGFGMLSGMCGVLAATDLTSATPELVRDTFTFERAYMDPADRPLLTAGGQHLAATPNAGGSSGLSEVFAFEELARCELATLLKTETEIVYDGTGKITDLEVEMDGHKIGVSVTRAMTYPFGGTYTLDAATMLISRKLTDIQASTAHVSAQDHWDKQILAVLAWDDQAADTVAQAWSALDAGTKADTIVVVSATAGDDLFIYSYM
jgi:hypothetical protein